MEEWRNQPAPAPREPDALDAAKSPEEQALEAKIADQIRLVFDPEIPVNVYDLGLIYAIHADAEGRVKIDMTLTAPGCPVAGELPLAVERRVEELDEVKSAKVELVWEPALGQVAHERGGDARPGAPVKRRGSPRRARRTRSKSRRKKKGQAKTLPP